MASTTTRTAPTADTAAALTLVREGLEQGTLNALRDACYVAELPDDVAESKCGRTMRQALKAWLDKAGKPAPAASQPAPAPVESKPAYTRQARLDTKPAAIPSDADLRALSKDNLLLLCGWFDVTPLRGAGGSTLQRQLAKRREQLAVCPPAPTVASNPPAGQVIQPVPTGPAPIQTEKPAEGPVSEPVQGPTGDVQCYTRQSLKGTTFAVATALQAITHAFATVRTAAELEQLLDVCEAAATATEERLKGSKPAPAPAAKPAPKVESKPAPVITPAPAPETTKTAANAPAPAPMAAQQVKTDAPALAKDTDPYAGRDGHNRLRKAVQQHEGLATMPQGKRDELLARLAKPAPKASKPAPAPKADPVVPGVFDAAGKPLTLSQVMAAVAKMPKAAA